MRYRLRVRRGLSRPRGGAADVTAPRPFRAGPPREAQLVFRLGPAQVAAPVLGGLLVGTALVCVLLAVTGERMTAGELWSCVSAALLASAALPLLSPSYGVELTDSRLVIRGAGRREIEWRDVTGLEVRRTVGGPDGRRLGVRRAPDTAARADVPPGPPLRRQGAGPHGLVDRSPRRQTRLNAHRPTAVDRSVLINRSSRRRSTRHHHRLRPPGARMRARWPSRRPRPSRGA